MIISRYNQRILKRKELNVSLSKLAKTEALELDKKRRLLAGYQNRLAIKSLNDTAVLEKKYAHMYGENWRSTVPSYKLDKIESDLSMEVGSLNNEREDELLKGMRKLESKGPSLIKCIKRGKL